jgi:hypothetical protein
MRFLVPLLIIVLGGCGSAKRESTVAVDRLPRLRSLDNPRRSIDGYRAIASRTADSLGLGRLDTSHDEVRIWWHFFLGDLQVLQLIRREGRWVALHLPTGLAPDTSSLDQRLQLAIPHLDRLSHLQQGSTGGIIVTDGGWYFLEWSLRGRTYFAGADNPGSYCSEYDQQLLGVVKALAPYRDSDRAACKGAT